MPTSAGVLRTTSMLAVLIVVSGCGRIRYDPIGLVAIDSADVADGADPIVENDSAEAAEGLDGSDGGEPVDAPDTIDGDGGVDADAMDAADSVDGDGPACGADFTTCTGGVCYGGVCCTGCIDTMTGCQAGNTNRACGVGGAFCAMCAGMATCTAGRCF